MGGTRFTEGDDAWIEDVAPEQIIREIDLEARGRLGMTLEEFVRAHRRGALEDTTAVNELVLSLRLVEPHVLDLPQRPAGDRRGRGGER